MTIFLAAVIFVITATILLLAVRRLCGFHRHKANAEPDSAEFGLQGRNQRDSPIAAAVVIGFGYVGQAEQALDFREQGQSNPRKQVGQRNLQAPRNLLNVHERDIPHSALNPAVVGPMKAASFGSLFLIDLPLFPHAADSAAKSDSDVQGHSLLSWNLAADTYTAYESHLRYNTSVREYYFIPHPSGGAHLHRPAPNRADTRRCRLSRLACRVERDRRAVAFFGGVFQADLVCSFSFLAGKRLRCEKRPRHIQCFRFRAGCFESLVFSRCEYVHNFKVRHYRKVR